jgi:hypothetical protein
MQPGHLGKNGGARFLSLGVAATAFDGLHALGTIGAYRRTRKIPFSTVRSKLGGCK